MTLDEERLLDLATRELEATPVERDQAKGELMARIAHGGRSSESADLTAPLAHLEAAATRAPSRRRIGLATAFALIVLATVAAILLPLKEVFLVLQLDQLASHQYYGSRPSTGENRFVANGIRARAPGLPLMPDSAIFHPSQTAVHLARHPDDLAMLQEHLMRQIYTHSAHWSGPSAKEQEIIDRLDSGNALWPLLRAFHHFNRATGGNFASFSHAVLDQAPIEEALRAFSEAAAKPYFRDHSPSLVRRQLDAFSPTVSIADDTLATVTPPDHLRESTLYRNAYQLVQVHCDSLIASSDREGLIRFFSEWKQLARSIALAGVSSSKVRTHIPNAFGVFDRAFGLLGMPKEKAEAKQWLNAIPSNPPSALLPEHLKQVAGVRVSVGIWRPSDLTEEELLPSFRAEMSYINRTLAAIAALVTLVFTSLIALECGRRSRSVKGTARSLMPLLRRDDHLWIAGLGIVLPWCWWWGLCRLPPLVKWDYSRFERFIGASVVQTAFVCILGMILLVQTARWRWSRRAGFLGLGSSPAWPGWMVAALTALAIPLIYRVHWASNDDAAMQALLVATGFAACGLLWLLWQGAMALFTPQEGALKPNVTSRAVLPWALVGTATLLVGAAVATAMERHWFAKDPLFPISTSKTHQNAWEERIAAESAAAWQKALEDL